jgi:acid phosphatase (class A)
VIASQRRRAGILAGIVALASAVGWWQLHDGRHYLSSDIARFAASFDPPPPRDSASTRRELDELLALQAARTPAKVAAARADRTTEIERFYGALGLSPDDAPELPALHRLAERVEDDVRIYVRAAKRRFLRLRPYEVEPRIAPCIDDVRGDLSYPSGHAAYAWSMAYLLSTLVPERERALDARAEEFARQRMVCGVHFASDLAAGREAARRLIDAMQALPVFREQLDAARTELRAALRLPP